MNTSIIGISNHIAEKIMTAQEVSDLSGFSEKYITSKLGFKTKRISTNEQHPSDFAISASKSVLKKTSIDPKEINFIIYCSSGIYDYQFWSPSGHIQKVLGAKNALTFEINNGCNSATMGMFLANNLITSQRWKYGLVITSDTLSKFIDYSDQSLFPLYSFSDGASALIIGKSNYHNIIAQSLYSNGEYAGCNKILLGGTRGTQIKNYSLKDRYIKLEDAEKIEKLRNNVIASSYMKVINDALEKSNINYNNLSFILTNQNTKKIINNVLKQLNIPKEKTYNTIEEYGHIASIDTLLALEICLEKNILKQGDFVLLATAGIGFNWGAQVIRI